MGSPLARKILAAALGAVVAGAWPIEVSAAAGPADAEEGARGSYPAAVLGIEALQPGDADASRALTRALRKALDDRGFGGAQSVTLVELRLALGCETNEPSCLAQGGPTLLTDALIYGTLDRVDGDLHVALTRLDVESATVVESIEQTLVPSDLLPGTIGGTAERLLSQLYPELEDIEPSAESELVGPTDPTPPPPPTTEPTPDSVESSDTLIARPVPKWKWAGLGVGIGLTVTGAVVSAVTVAMLRGSVRDAVFEAAEGSVNDCIDPTDPDRSVPCEAAGDTRNEANDVDPNMQGDLCDAGRSKVDALGNPLMGGEVRNKDVADACVRAQRIENAAIASLVVTGVGLVTTAVFTTLLFFPLRKNRRAAAFLRREPRLGFTPTRGGGMMGGSIRF